jgi:hypothetical protein
MQPPSPAAVLLAERAVLLAGATGAHLTDVRVADLLLAAELAWETFGIGARGCPWTVDWEQVNKGIPPGPGYV